MVNELLGLSLKQCFKNFKIGIARSSKKDHRSYAQVVSGKGDSAYSLQHKVHSNTDAQYSTSTHSPVLACNNSMLTNRGSEKASTVCPDPVIQSHPRITPQQKQVSGSSQVKRQAVTSIDRENMPISVQNRFQILSDVTEECLESDSFQAHTLCGLVEHDTHVLVPTTDMAVNKVSHKGDLSVSVHNVSNPDTVVYGEQVIGSIPTHTVNTTMTGDTHEMYVKCRQQIGEQFRCIPLDTFVTYKGPDVHWAVIPDILQAHRLIKDSGIPNFLGMRIPVKTNLNIVNWRKYLVDYFDQQLLDLIQFGFPLDFDRNTVLCSTYKNHASAYEFASHVDKYIQEELHHGAIMGPFKTPPIPLHISPFMTRPKSDSNTRRTIIDLSWPKGHSVNDGVGKQSYLGTDFLLKYPSVDSIIRTLNKLGPACSIFKIDISCAFRHIRIDPGDLDLLGLQHLDQYYLDLSLPFGYRLGSIFFQKLSDSIRYIMNKNGFLGLHNYLDNLIYCGLPSEVQKPYQFLTSLLQELGLAISQKKLCPPSTQVVCLGILFDTKTRTMSIPPEKMSDIRNICSVWSDKRVVSKSELQSLLGSLLYVTKCVKSSRSFLNRMLQLLRDNSNTKDIVLTTEFFKDLRWFNTFLQVYNGVTMYQVTPLFEDIHLDASLTGLGGQFKNYVYSIAIPRDYMGYNIAHLEMLNVVVALKVWGQQWANKCVRLYCDNQAVVEVLSSGKARDQILAMCTRNVWLLTATYNIDLLVSHIQGTKKQCG